MSPALIVIGSVELAVLAVLVAVVVRRRRRRSDMPTSPPSRLEQVLDEHDRDVPLRGPDPREDEQR